MIIVVLKYSADQTDVCGSSLDLDREVSGPRDISFGAMDPVDGEGVSYLHL